MKRPLCVIGASFAVAMAVAFFIPLNESIVLIGALLVTAILCILLRHKKLQGAAIGLLTASIALAYGSVYQVKKVLPYEALYEQDTLVNGLVKEAKQTGSNTWRYTLQVDFLEESLPAATIVLREYGDNTLRVGDMIQTTTRLTAPKYATTQEYYRRTGIVGEGILEQAVVINSPTGKYWIQSKVLGLQALFSGRIHNALPPESAALIDAMVLGNTEGLDSALYTALNRSGTSHLVSVSGLHLSILANIAAAILVKSKLSRRKQVPIVLFVIFAFTVLVGFSAPIVRAFITTGIMLLAQLGSRKSDALSSLGLALVVVLCLWPHWILSLGTWLSFLSTAGILVLGSPVEKQLTKRFGKEGKIIGKLSTMATEGIGITLGAYVFTLPVLVIATGVISIISPLANVLVSPFATLATLGGILLFLLPSHWGVVPVVAKAVDIASKGIVGVSKLLAGLPFATISLDYMYLLLCFLGILGLVVVAVKFRQVKRIVGITVLCSVLLLAMGNLSHLAVYQNAVELVILDDCNTVLLLRGKSAVLLGLPTKYQYKLLLNYLEFREVKNIEALIIPDQGEQIQRGLLLVAESYPITCIVGPDDSYLLDLLATSVPGVPVYAAGYAHIEVLGRVEISFSSDQNQIIAQIGRQTLLKSTTRYDILQREEIIFQQGSLYLPQGVVPLWEPLAASLFQETRLIL